MHFLNLGVKGLIRIHSQHTCELRSYSVIDGLFCNLFYECNLIAQSEGSVFDFPEF